VKEVRQTERRSPRSGTLRAAVAALALGVGLHACGGATPPAEVGTASGSPTYRIDDPLVREIAPFQVTGPEGDSYGFPFLGGFDVPRPHLVDIDADGDLDLFVQKYSGSLMLFENVGDATTPVFEWQTSEYQNLDVGEWARFHDLDGDGDQDLLMELPSSYVRFVENVGTPQVARFAISDDSVRTSEGKALFSDAQNIPWIVDLDCNDRPDLFLGRIDGTVSRYQLTGFEDGLPVFELEAERFEDIEIVAAFAVPGGVIPPAGGPSPDADLFPGGNRPTLHGANSMAFGDWDQDGDVDLYWGDFFEAGVLLIENIGSNCARPNLLVDPIPVPADREIVTSGYNAPAPADLNGDGHLDLLVGVLGGAFNANRTAADNLYYYTGQPDNVLAFQSARLLDGIDVGSEAVPTFGDLDGDGDLDLLMGSKLDPETNEAPALHRYENVGTPTAPSFVSREGLAGPSYANSAPLLTDLDADGDLDLLVGTFNRDVRYFRNDGTRAEPRFTVVSDEPIADLPRGSYSTPTVGDLDDDGDLDLVIGESSGELNHFRNVGSPTEPIFELVTEQLGGIDVGFRSSPLLVDVDGDGDLDLLVGEESGGIFFHENLGTVREPRFAEEGIPFERLLPRLAAPRLHDLDGDGDLDLIVGDQGGGLVFHRNERG